MSVIIILIAYLLTWLMGWLLVQVLDKKQTLSVGLKVFVAFMIGSGVLTFEMFVLSLLHTPVTRVVWIGILLGNIVLAIAAISFWHKRSWLGSLRQLREIRLDWGSVWWSKTLVVLSLGLIVFRVLLSLWQVTHIPTYEFDAWNNWNLRSKIIYYEQQIPLDKEHDYYLGGGIVSYPLNVSLYKTFLADMNGEWDEAVVNTLSVAFYICLLGIFYFSLPKSFHDYSKLSATALLSGMPFVYLHSAVAYADLAFAVYVVLLVGSIYQYVKTHSLSNLSLSLLAMVLCIWTKNEGLVIIVPVLMIGLLFFVSRETLSYKRLLYWWGVALIALSPWLGFKMLNGLGALSGDSGSFNIVFNQSFISQWFETVFLQSSFNFLFLLLFVLILWQAKHIWRHQDMRFVVFMFVGLFVLNNAVILFTDRALDLGALARVNMHIAPLGLMVVVIVLSKVAGLHYIFEKAIDN